MLRTALLALFGALAVAAQPAGNSPLNQVFQFVRKGTYSAWNDGAKTNDPTTAPNTATDLESEATSLLDVRV